MPTGDLVKETIMREFWRRIIREQRNLTPRSHGNTFCQDQQIHVPCLHISEKHNFTSRSNNRYAVLTNEAPAPRADELRHQLEQMQHQIRGMHRQLQNQVEERPRFHDSYPRHVRQDVPSRHGSPSTTYHRTNAPPSLHGGHQGGRYPAPEARRYKPQWRVKTPSKNFDHANRNSQQLATSSQHGTMTAPRWEQPMPSRTAPLTNRPSRVPYASTINQRKRERRRRTREAMYHELQDLVLKHVRVRVRADGRIYRDNERITLQISPNLERNERYNFLIENLAPRPRRVEPSDHVVTQRGRGNTRPQQESHSTRSENDENRMRQANRQRINTVSCGMTSVRALQNSDTEWEPPVVLHEYSYSSDEEILPNPTPLFMRNSRHLNEHPKRHALENERKEAIVSASCLPLTSRGDQTPVDKILLRTSDYSRPYASISSRLPTDEHEVKQIAQRTGAVTRLRRVAQGTTIFSESSSSDEHTGNELSDEESSASSQKVVGSPNYGGLVTPQSFDDEDVCGAMNLASVQVHSNQDGLAQAGLENQNDLPQGSLLAQTGEGETRAPDNHEGTSSSQHTVSDYSKRIDSMDAKIDQLFSMIASLTHLRTLLLHKV